MAQLSGKAQLNSLLQTNCTDKPDGLCATVDPCAPLTAVPVPARHPSGHLTPIRLSSPYRSPVRSVFVVITVFVLITAATAPTTFIVLISPVRKLSLGEERCKI